MLLATVMIAGVFAFACSSGDDASAPATQPPAGTQPSPTPGVAAEPAEPDGDRIVTDVIELSDGIGPRPTGTEQEVAAAELLADRLRDLGFEVELQEFPVGSQIGRSSSLSVETPAPRTITTLPLENAGATTVTAPVVVAGIGRTEEFPQDTQDAVALIARGELFFDEKVANAVAAGAAAVIIYNNEAGPFYGTLGTPAEIPVVAISDAEGQALRREAEAGDVSVEVSVGEVSDATSFNVVAEPPDRDCETVTGGHYDSVIQAPGASDNATGTATVVEIASVLSQNGDIDAHCFVLFGAEEIGLVGSQYYVSELTDEERGRIKAMLNFDMVGVGEAAWWLIGTPDLQQRIISLAEELQIAGAEPGTLGAGFSSDHASFLDADIPALMFHRWEDPLLHTPEDVSERVEPRYLEEAARMGVALLESLAAEG